MMESQVFVKYDISYEQNEFLNMSNCQYDDILTT